MLLTLDLGVRLELCGTMRLRLQFLPRHDTFWTSTYGFAYAPHEVTKDVVCWCEERFLLLATLTSDTRFVFIQTRREFRVTVFHQFAARKTRLNATTLMKGERFISIQAADLQTRAPASRVCVSVSSWLGGSSGV